MDTRLHKSTKDKIISGVCGGLGEYFRVDSSIIRIIWAIAAFAYGTGILLYIIAAIILPSEDYEKVEGDNKSENILNADNSKLIGIVLIISGVLFLLRQFTPFLDSKYVWPVILIVLGLFIIVKGGSRDHEE
ncbi:phage shock protein C (PspC) family protein [Alkalibaculum bacchi]|uniref:Phage shock protein C (PspC) family protein n=1 Tax=Alkalibaculum bacchi TaxID=645887 RepID=A0A366I529_9FIRM|nr:PspC domain-containing protein [Alkalibaculum bacchi]RBP63264.1 phage shock protein C (PspC) family protein [Alkalibaculum bacchi]